MPKTSMNILPHLTALSLALVAMVLVPAALAVEKRWYQAEVIIFERLANVHVEEQHPMTLAAKVRTSKQLQTYPNIGSQAFTRLPKEYRRLNTVAKNLQQSGYYKVLFHEAWPMPVRKQKSATWIKIEAGKKQADHRQLEGAIGVSLGRYLHLHTQLHLNQFTNDGTNVQTELSNLFNYPTSQAKVTQRFSMIQKRKMRSVELHFMDHPKLALLVRFDPYSPQTGPLPRPAEALGNSATKITSENLSEAKVSALAEAEIVPLAN